MRSINLIPPDRLAARRLRRRVATWVRRTFGLGVLLLLVQGALGLEVQRRAKLVEALREDFTRLQERLRTAEGIIEERDRLTERQSLLRTIERGPSAARSLEVIGHALPPSAYLSYVGVVSERARDAPPGTPGHVQLTLKGVADSHAEVGAILGGLRASSRFRSVTLVDSKDEMDAAGSRRVLFEVSCAVEERSDG
jgi:hypothetical protein